MYPFLSAIFIKISTRISITAPERHVAGAPSISAIRNIIVSKLGNEVGYLL